MRGKNVLVAGGSGLVGSGLTRRLDALGASVRSTCRSRRPAELTDLYRRYDFTEPDDCLAAARDMDWVFLCAAETFGAKVMKDNPTSLVLPNLRITSGLLEACRLARVERVVLISSSTVYQEAFHPIREDELDLNLPVYPLYQGVGWMKRYVEQLARFYHDRYGLQVGVVRPSNIYGPHDKFDEDKSHVLPALIRRAVGREDPFLVWGAGNTVRDFLYVEDLVGDLLAVARHYCVAEPLNLASGVAITIREAVSTILDVCQHRVEPSYDPSKPEAIPYRMLDTTKAEAVLGKPSRTPFRAGIEETVRWYRATGGVARAA